MPNYEYKCTREGTLFELWQEVGAEAPPCPNCGAPSKKVFRPTRVIFKGSGFYITDTRSESGSAKSEAKEKEEASETKSEATPATTSTDSSPSTESKPSAGAAK